MRSSQAETKALAFGSRQRLNILWLRLRRQTWQHLVVPQRKLFDGLTQRPHGERLGKCHQAVSGAQAATDAALILSMESVFAALLGYLFLSERFTLTQTIGSALVMAAILLSQIPVNHFRKPIPKLENDKPGI